MAIGISSASLVLDNIDLLINILLFLPIASLLKCRSVSKHWHTVISSHCFTNLRTPFPMTLSGIFLRNYSTLNYVPFYNFIDLTSPNSTNSKPLYSWGPYYLNFAQDPSGIRILQSCNGLFLCSSSVCNRNKARYYIFSPTTSQNCKIPQQGLEKKDHYVVGVSLAFDPSKSPHYKVICVSRKEREYWIFNLHQIQIFSSKNGSWRVSNCGYFSASDGTSFNSGVFCNGAIHWYSTLGGTSLFYDIEEDHVKHVPLPPIQGDWGERRVGLEYFGACRDHLHLIEFYEPRKLEFIIYEMEKDFSVWFVKYNVDLRAVPIAFPNMIRSVLGRWNLNYYVFSILCVVESEVEEDSYLVINTPGKIVRYNFKDKKFYALCDNIGADESSIMIGSSEAHQYFESLFCF